jgi:hypothetical protein
MRLEGVIKNFIIPKMRRYNNLINTVYSINALCKNINAYDVIRNVDVLQQLLDVCPESFAW